MWLEIDGDVIVGVHSDRCKNDYQWVEHEGDAKPGDTWIDGKVTAQQDEPGPDELRRIAARAQIVAFYPEWKQLNILREGDAQSITTMGTFIDACRSWSNDPTSNMADISNIKP